MKVGVNLMFYRRVSHKKNTRKTGKKKKAYRYFEYIQVPYQIKYGLRWLKLS
jgi:hypothetical protein